MNNHDKMEIPEGTRVYASEVGEPIVRAAGHWFRVSECQIVESAEGISIRHNIVRDKQILDAGEGDDPDDPDVAKSRAAHDAGEFDIKDIPKRSQQTRKQIWEEFDQVYAERSQKKCPWGIRPGTVVYWSESGIPVVRIGGLQVPLSECRIV